MVASAAPWLMRRAGHRTPLIAALAPAVTFGWGLTQYSRVRDGDGPAQSLTWVEELGVGLGFRLDGLSLMMLLLISGIGTLVLVYSSSYLSARPDLGRITGLIVAFAGAMTGLVLAANFLGLYVFWELTAITSYLLIGLDDKNTETRWAANHALLLTATGSLAMLAGIVVVGQAAGTYELAELVAAFPGSGTAEVGVVLLLAGAFTKSAMVPSHGWLPAAMAAPTPVSAYLHSATMVKAGVYLVARLAPGVADVVSWWRPVVMVVGGVTMIFAGYRALRQYDLKLLLAYSTISQLGFMVVLLGAGTPAVGFAGMAVLLAHAVFKALLFLVVGIVDKYAGGRDLRHLTGVGRAMPHVAVMAAIGAASMAGVPPLFGFVAKETVLEELSHSGLGTLGSIALAAVLVGSVLTVAYSARFVWGAFGGPVPAGAAGSSPAQRPLALAMVVPVGLLAALTVGFGLVVPVVDGLVVMAGEAVDPALSGTHLKLWHGFTLTLAMSAGVLALGAALHILRDAVERAQEKVASSVSASEMFLVAHQGTVRAAERVTALLQRGSLPFYLMVVLTTLVVVPGTALVREGVVPTGLRAADSVTQAVALTFVALAALAVVTASRRIVAILFLGAVGYGNAFVFVVHGAPDLALTQVMVETVAVVALVLVIHRLPDLFHTVTSTPAVRRIRLAISVAVGVFVATFALMAAGTGSRPSTADYAERALPEADGRNVVNVILTDFRALDTMGEIVVVAVAGIGVLSLTRAIRNRDR